LIPLSEVAFAPSPAMTANMNAYIDLIMIQVGPWILRSGLIPMELPDYVEIIEHRPILITYTGELHLTNGALTRLVSVARSGNAIMTYERNMLRIAMAASIRQIAVSLRNAFNPRTLSPLSRVFLSRRER
jgi:Group 7 allergen